MDYRSTVMRGRGNLFHTQQSSCLRQCIIKGQATFLADDD